MFESEAEAPPAAFRNVAGNPCWGGGASTPAHCLPAFHILGVYQSGVRDLITRLMAHPAIADHPAVSPSFYSEVRKWSEYLRQLAPATQRAAAGELIGEASAVTFHFVWVHQERFNQKYVKSMGRFWQACNARSAAEKAAVAHRDCMAAKMPEARAAEAEEAAAAGVRLQPPTLMRAVYGSSYEPRLIVLLRKPWTRMHAAFHNYVHYRNKYGDNAAGELAWVRESVGAFRRCETAHSTEDCALRFESLDRLNEETFYHCDQLIKGMYHVFMPKWVHEFRDLLPLRAEQYWAQPKRVLGAALAFIGVAEPDADGWRRMLEVKRQLHGPRPPGGLPPIPEAVARELAAFYRDGLRQLVEQPPIRDAPDRRAWVEWSLL